MIGQPAFTKKYGNGNRDKWQGNVLIVIYIDLTLAPKKYGAFHVIVRFPDAIDFRGHSGVTWISASLGWPTSGK